MERNLSSPFNLKKRLTSPKLRLNTSALASVLLVAFFMFAMTSKFIFAPGISIEFSDENAAVDALGNDKIFASKTAKDESAGTLALPIFEGRLSGAEASAVLTVKNDAMFIFDGKIYRNLSDEIPPDAAENLRTRGGLLAKLDKSVSVQIVFDIAKAAQNAGFSAVQIAGESQKK